MWPLREHQHAGNGSGVANRGVGSSDGTVESGPAVANLGEEVDPQHNRNLGEAASNGGGESFSSGGGGDSRRGGDVMAGNNVQEEQRVENEEYNDVGAYDQQRVQLQQQQPQQQFQQQQQQQRQQKQLVMHLQQDRQGEGSRRGNTNRVEEGGTGVGREEGLDNNSCYEGERGERGGGQERGNCDRIRVGMGGGNRRTEERVGEGRHHRPAETEYCGPRAKGRARPIDELSDGGRKRHTVSGSGQQ